MIVKIILKIGVLGIELFLAFYSVFISDSLLVKFLFFAFSAIIVAFAVTRITNSLLPSDKDYYSDESLLPPDKEYIPTEQEKISTK